MIYTLYFILFSIFAFLNCFVIKQNRGNIYLLLIISFFLLVFQDGFRWDVGTDWGPYYMYFEQCNTVQSDSDEFEIGYVLLNKIINTFTDNYTVFLVVHALLLYFSVFYFIRKISLYPLLSVLLYYAFMNANMGMNRQFLALMVALISVRFILQREIIKFSICIIVGFLFHSSILLFFPAYFLCSKLSMKVILVLLFLGIVISISGVINLIPFELLFVFDDRMAFKMDTYTSAGVANVSLINTILALYSRVIWLVILLIFRDKYNDDFECKDKFNLCFNLYLVSIFFYMIFNGSILQIIISRGLIYYGIFAVIAIPYVFTCFKGNANKLIAFSMIVFYAWIMFAKNMNAHIDTVGDIFNPYTNVLF